MLGLFIMDRDTLISAEMLLDAFRDDVSVGGCAGMCVCGCVFSIMEPQGWVRACCFVTPDCLTHSYTPGASFVLLLH